MNRMDDPFGQRVPTSLPIANVLDNDHSCSYLPDRVASLPLIYPGRLVRHGEFDHVLEHGLRRSGVFMYYTQCKDCRACEPTRVEVSQFRWTDSWRRILNRGDRSLSIQIGPPIINEVRLAIFNRHRTERSLGEANEPYTFDDYEGFLIDTCCEESAETSFWLGNELVAVSIVDCGKNSLSAVYTYFDPDQSRYSLGSYSILKQIQIAMSTGRRYLYLGMYVADNAHLNYKSRFLPQQRLVNGTWIDVRLVDKSNHVEKRT